MRDPTGSAIAGAAATSEVSGAITDLQGAAAIRRCHGWLHGEEDAGASGLS